ncbi:hypothetical protein CASFOL_035490 [Castilleja foliolosa]|uniref:Uncharacterized protein n=1 Tax=Castilleja foliolosa TaxID=1961234 RepID=A0ABD3BSR2_9LAMI
MFGSTVMLAIGDMNLLHLELLVVSFFAEDSNASDYDIVVHKKDGPPHRLPDPRS